uniref:Retrotransposon Orf1 n=1 Tax=Tanacetum cinerariifolium TaxID=118510 RepID=A0A6L2K5E3_TANCI|nr:retrotransposon Orf1 [Tanacetum cinerariifolium]
MGGNNDEAKSSRSKRSRQYKTVKEVLLPQVHHEFLLWEGCNKDAKSRYNTKLANLLPRHVYSSCIMNRGVLNRMGCDGEIDDMLRIKLREAESNEDIFTSVAWIRAFNIKKPIYSELCHKFYSTYEFDEVCADDELETKKIIKFRLGGRAHSLTLLEFARRLGLYHADEIDEDGFDAPPRASMQDLYERMGNMEIRHGVINRMSYTQSYHWDMYAGVFEHMVGVYIVDLQGAYNPPGYAQP